MPDTHSGSSNGSEPVTEECTGKTDRRVSLFIFSSAHLTIAPYAPNHINSPLNKQPSLVALSSETR